MQLIGLLIVGLIIGMLARLLVPGRQRLGLAFTLTLGVAGALIGGTLASVIGAGEIFELNFVGFVAAVLSSVGLLTVADRAGLGEGRGKRRDLPRGR